MTCRNFSLKVLALVLALVPVPVAYAGTNSLALTPPMGWNDWNNYGCSISETIVKNTADAMATNGMKAAGYQFVNIDDCWQISRDAFGVIVPDAGKFPNGIKALADYVHSKGLKLGVYTDHGLATCAHKPGSFGYEYLDAYTYASWGVDYLKNDSCNQPAGDDAHADYFRLWDGLMKAGRPIVASLCPNMEHYEYWSPDVGNLWRTTGDINNTFASMISKIDQNSRSAYVAGPGRWNDADMLEVGRGDFTNTIPAQSHFTMWSIMAAPLLAGNNITSMSADTLAILTNPEAIAVNQDPAGEQAVRVSGVVDLAEVWSKPLGYDFTTRAVALFNRSTTAATNITCVWTNLGLQAGSATLRDLWTHTDLGTFTDSYTANVPAEGVVFLKIVGTPVAAPGLGTTYVSDLRPIYAYTGFGTMTKDKSINGGTLTLAGVTYVKGIGTHAIGGSEYNLGGVASRFQSDIGVDDEVGTAGSVIFQVIADGRKIYDSGIMTGSSATKTIDLDVTGVRRLTLGVTDIGNDVTGSRNSNDHSDWANARVIVTNTVPVPPVTPTDLTANPGSQIKLSWNETTGAVSYNVKRSITSGGTYTNAASVPTALYTDTDVVNGTTYYYVVSAVNGIGESTNTPQVAVTGCLTPGMPTNLIATVVGQQVSLKWNAVSGVSSYNVSRATSMTPYSSITNGLVTTNYTDSTGVAGTTYFYAITAVSACNQSALSAFAGAILPPVPPPVPTGLAATPGNTQIALAWNASAGATGYNVKRSASVGGTYIIIATNIAATGYLDTGLTNGVADFYVVSALGIGGESADASPVSAVPSMPSSAYWTNVVTSAAQSWNANGNWTNAATFPNSVGGTAQVGTDIAAAQTINLNQGITVGTLSIGDANGSSAYTIAGNGGTLTLNNGTSSATLLQVATSKGDTISAPITISTSAYVINNSANPLTIAGTVSGAGAGVTISVGSVKVGDGTVNGSLGVSFITNNGALSFLRSDNPNVTAAISGSGSLTQGGTGILKLSGSNSFSGPVTVASGTLQAGSTNALGTNGAGMLIGSGAVFDVNGFSMSGEAVTVSGSGIGGKGAIINNGGQQTAGLRNVTMTADTTLGGGLFNWNPGNNMNRWDIRAASTSSTNGCTLSTGGHPYKLTKTSGNQISMVAVAVDPKLGDIDVQQGLMGWETATSSMGNPASNIFVRAGATLSFFNASTLWNKVFVLFGDGIAPTITNWSGANTIIGPVQLNGNCIFTGGGTSLTLSNKISGPGTLTKNGAYTLVLAGTNIYSGNTVVNGGILILAGAASISNSPIVNITPAGILDAGQLLSGMWTLANGQTLKGSGTIYGNVTAGNGATLAPGGSFTTLSFSNSLTLAGGSTTIIELGKSPLTNDAVNVAGSLVYGGTLVATNISAFSLASGDTFKLFNAANYSGGFTNIVPPIPGSGLAWVTTGLTNNGTLSVTTVTPPHIGALTLTSGKMGVSGTGGVANAPYYILSSTNAALPTAQWSRIKTNNFDADGNFSFTNNVDPSGPGTFYMLQLP